MRRLMAPWAAFVLLAALGIGPVAAVTVTGGISGLGSAYSTTSESSGYGNLTTAACEVGVTSSPSAEYARCALEYDITSIPAGATITAAYLGLHSGTVPACVSAECIFDVAGYVGDAATTLGDLTAGSPVATGGPMGRGEEAVLDVTGFVQARHLEGDIIAGFRIGRHEFNPDNDRVTISHPSSANPPKLVIRYGFLQTLTIEMAGTGQGRVISVPEGIDCPGDCSGTFIGTSTVALDVEALNGGSFGSWEETSPCGGRIGGCKLRMPDNALTVTIYFTAAAAPSGAPTPSPSAGATTRPSTGGTGTPSPAASSGPSATGMATAAPSGLATLEPVSFEPSPSGALGVETPGASSDTTGTGAPLEPAAESGGSMVIPLLLLIAMVVIGGAGFVALRSRRAAAVVAAGAGAGPMEPPSDDA